MPSAVKLVGVQMRTSAVLAMQYRWDFLASGVLSLGWTVLGMVPLHVAFEGRGSVGGWRFEEALVVVGWFTLLKGFLDGAINPSLLRVVEQIRQGTLDFVLLKPADAQLLVSTAKVELWKVLDCLAGCAIFAWAFAAMGRAPAVVDVALAAVMLVCALVVLYSVWILVIAAAFWVVRLDNLSYMFNAIFDFARWPVSMFRGVWSLLFTFVVPLALMTTYPAQALLGTLSPLVAVGVGVGSAIFAAIARAVWRRAIAHYTSASS